MEAKQALAALAVLIGGTQAAAAAENVDLRTLQLLSEEGISAEEFEAQVYPTMYLGNYSNHSISSSNYSNHSISAGNYSNHSISGSFVPVDANGAAFPAPVLSAEVDAE